MDAVTAVPQPRNEPVWTYAPGSPEQARIEEALKTAAAETVEITLTVGGEQRAGTGDELVVTAPHRHDLVLARGRGSTQADATAAIDAALRAAPAWRELSFDARAAVFLRAADLLAGPWRDRSNALTMLGQSKTVFQSEIDAVCELVDFWRWNVHFAREILAGQPVSTPGVWNRTDHRPLEGFVYAVTPFNFTSIAGNLPTAPALMGNTVVWKPATTQLLAAQATMRLLEEAGLPPGVINLLPGHGAETSAAVLPHPALAGIHFTGSTATFSSMWRGIADNLSTYRTYPRLVGETGGKDFVLAHPSADPAALRTALIRGAFEYQGQKCSAASRAFVPRSVWNVMGSDLLAQTASLPMGDIADLSNFMGAVIDDRAYAKLSGAIERARAGSTTEVLVGGECDDSEGYFVRPTIVATDDPTNEVLAAEYFGPLLGLFVYEDSEWDRVLTLVDSGSPYGLTGAVFANDRYAVEQASAALRFTAGNFYVNDKPTGAVVGQQPFGGSRASGTNDKAGSPLNLLRWVSPRSIKETLVPPTDWRYPHMG
ncbi:L-glutamate gamma-semialdehyde dehydrogenase [Sporichthya sp.]|uniref:L-glutamate gamma-semialdehyde dehydrogenase n=1 Tax=Sporichthya sp. TaxID=65475 RepID=UPI00180E4D7F|nr:L-glutamate gamma-semialdehyde dehydrogenase [Sporichthya sp.]MBA3744194.1 L-glutamate gamma-semialdehyde dehydrogenase [Sporichthya sp.]